VVHKLRGQPIRFAFFLALLLGATSGHKAMAQSEFVSIKTGDLNSTRPMTAEGYMSLEFSSIRRPVNTGDVAKYQQDLETYARALHDHRRAQEWKYRGEEYRYLSTPRANGTYDYTNPCKTLGVKWDTDRGTLDKAYRESRAYWLVESKFVESQKALMSRADYALYKEALVDKLTHIDNAYRTMTAETIHGKKLKDLYLEQARHFAFVERDGAVRTLDQVVTQFNEKDVNTVWQERRSTFKSVDTQLQAARERRHLVQELDHPVLNLYRTDGNLSDLQGGRKLSSDERSRLSAFRHETGITEADYANSRARALSSTPPVFKMERVPFGSIENPCEILGVGWSASPREIEARYQAAMAHYEREAELLNSGKASRGLSAQALKDAQAANAEAVEKLKSSRSLLLSSSDERAKFLVSKGSDEQRRITEFNQKDVDRVFAQRASDYKNLEKQIGEGALTGRRIENLEHSGVADYRRRQGGGACGVQSLGSTLVDAFSR
jgi:hypothetical protein